VCSPPTRIDAFLRLLEHPSLLAHPSSLEHLQCFIVVVVVPIPVPVSVFVAFSRSCLELSFPTCPPDALGLTSLILTCVSCVYISPPGLHSLFSWSIYRLCHSPFHPCRFVACCRGYAMSSSGDFGSAPEFPWSVSDFACPIFTPVRFVLVICDLR